VEPHDIRDQCRRPRRLSITLDFEQTLSYTKNMPKSLKLFLFGGVLIFALIVLAFVIYAFRVPGFLFPEEAVSLKGTVFNFKSEISPYKIEKGSVDSRVLEKILVGVGFRENTSSFGIFGQNELVLPSKIKTVYKDISGQSLESVINPTRSGGDLISGFGSSYNEESRELTYFVFVNPEVFEGQSEKEISEALTGLTVRLFCLALNNIIEPEVLDRVTYELNAELRNSGESLFAIELQKRTLGLIKEVYAECRGAYSCGRYDTKESP